MRIIYSFLVYMVIILSPLIIIYRIYKKKENPKRFLEKFSFNKKKRRQGKLVWFHCSSVGEFLSIVPLIEMLEKQKDIGKTLEQLIKEMKGSGEQNGLGSMNEIKRDIDDVVNDLQRKRFNKKTESRQEKILSRMLDSQLSMTERDYKEERKAVFSTKIIKDNIGGLPNDLGQRRSITLKALNSAMRAGYSKEHQDMIKYYFNSLDQLGNDE